MDDLLARVKTVLILSAHADDCEFFAGGFVAWLARRGAAITEVIATDNGRGSFELASSELVTQSREIEAQQAARIIGKKDVFFLNHPDGFLDDVPKNELRRVYMEWVRRIKPDLLLTFDPFAPFETHPDHIHVARAAVEAAGFAHLPLYHPEQIEAGLEPHRTPLTYYFAKSSERCNVVHDIGETLETKIEALAVQTSQMRMTITDIKRSLELTGRSPELLPFLDVDNYRPALAMLVTAWAAATAKDQPFEYGEAFRRECAGDLFAQTAGS
jgi:LmbE family N-acetylglucosaminyl deacetylase